MVSTMTSAEKVKIPEGYKQTEVGVIPNSWNVLPIGKFCDVSSGGTPNRENKEYWEGDIPWVTTALINGGVITQAEQFITPKAVECSSTKWFKSGTLLIAMYGQGKTRGKVSVLGIDATINQACAGITITKSISGSFLLHYLNSQYEEIRDLSNSGGQENLSGSIVKLINVPIPPESEQIAIANALSDVDNLIAALETLIAKKSAIKTAAMQQLLTGKKRLPAFEGKSEGKSEKQSAGASDKIADNSGETQAAKPSSEFEASSNHNTDAANTNNQQTAPRPGYKHTELGEIPEDWEVVGLGCLFENKITRKRVSEKSEVTFIGMQDVSESAKINNLHKVKYTDVKSGFTYFERNDVLVAKITPCFENGKGAFTDVLETEIGFGSTEFHVLRATSDTDSKYLYYFTNTEKFRKELEGEMVGSAGHRRVPLSSIQTYQVAISRNKEEQTAIANVLSDMDTELDALQQRLAKTKTIKQGMMQELLTGKTRLV